MNSVLRLVNLLLTPRTIAFTFCEETVKFPRQIREDS